MKNQILKSVMAMVCLLGLSVSAHAATTFADVVASMTTTATSIAGQIFDVAVPALVVFAALWAIRIGIRAFKAVAK